MHITLVWIVSEGKHSGTGRGGGYTEREARQKMSTLADPTPKLPYLEARWPLLLQPRLYIMDSGSFPERGWIKLPGISRRMRRL